MAGITVFRIAIEHWPSETSERDRPQLIREPLDELEAVAAANDRRHQGREIAPPGAPASRRLIRRRPACFAGDRGRLGPEATVLPAHTRSLGESASPSPRLTSVGKAEVAWP